MRINIIILIKILKLVLTILISGMIYRFYYDLFFLNPSEINSVFLYKGYSFIKSFFSSAFYGNVFPVIVYVLPFFFLFYRKKNSFWKNFLIPTLLSTLFLMAWVYFLAFGGNFLLRLFFLGIVLYPIFYLVYIFFHELFKIFCFSRKDSKKLNAIWKRISLSLINVFLLILFLSFPIYKNSETSRFFLFLFFISNLIFFIGLLKYFNGSLNFKLWFIIAFILGFGYFLVLFLFFLFNNYLNFELKDFRIGYWLWLFCLLLIPVTEHIKKLIWVPPLGL